MKARKIIFIAAAICLLICIGWMLREPTHCALCKAAESDVPYLIDLHSGEVAELRISDYELSDDPSTFVFSFIDVLGNSGFRDTGVRLCKVMLRRTTWANHRVAFAGIAGRNCRD